VTSAGALLTVTDLVKYFPVAATGFRRSAEKVHAVDGVSLAIMPGETLGLVGESGCGKSTLGRCVLRLIDPTSGTITFQDTDITRLSRKQLRPLRREMQMVFQDPYASLNPRRRVRDIVSEPLRIHRVGDEKQIATRVAELLSIVGLDQSHALRYPHEFSGGQRQRIGIARALALNPKLIVADEPVSALDVSIQSQILNLLDDLQDEFNLTYLFIAHNLGVVRHVSDRIGVMYLGELVEVGPAEAVYRHPMHPYTEALISAVPVIDTDDAPRRERIVLTGDVPNPIEKPTGCPFHPRCRYATDVCRADRPLLEERRGGHRVACHHPRLGAGGVPSAPA
jgi:peptide/nickel transport system ATP-binding protein